MWPSGSAGGPVVSGGPPPARIKLALIVSLINLDSMVFFNKAGPVRTFSF